MVRRVVRERWLPVIGYEENYLVSDLGRVKSLIANGTKRKVPKIVRGYITKKGYVHVCLTKNGKEAMRFAHVLVMQAFVGPKPDGMETCHKDGVRTNNRLSNLRYDTPQGNWVDRRLHGRATAGDSHPMRKLSSADVAVIRELLNQQIPQAAIARQFGVGQTSISNIKERKTWKAL